MAGVPHVNGRQRPVDNYPQIRLPRTGRGWLADAMSALAVLAAAAAVVSWNAQYVMVARARHTLAIAALEAGIPDAGAAVFATLGIAWRCTSGGRCAPAH